MLLGLTKKRIINTLLIATTLPLVVVSCGGGSDAPAAGGGPSVSTQAAPTNPISINSTTSRNTASIFSDFSNLNGNFSGFGGGSASSTTRTTGVSVSEEVSYKQLVTNVSRKFFKPNNSSVTGAITNCPNGGTVTEPDWTPPGTFNGTFTFNENNCKNGTVTTNGSMVFSGNITITGTPNNYEATDINGTFTFNNLTESDTSTNSISSIDGAITVVMNNSAGVSTFRIKGSTLTFRDATEVTELKNFDISVVSDINTSINTFDINFIINSSQINGSISVATPVTFKISTGIPPKDYPYEGQVIITGLNASKFRLTVDTPAVGGGIASDTVTIDVDEDGDGVYEINNSYKWSKI